MPALEIAINQLINKTFSPGEYILTNESHLHHVPKNSQTHWRIYLVSKKFIGMARVARHQAIYKALNHYLNNNPIHALAIEALTPDEHAKRKQPAKSPACRGGFGT